MPRHGDERRAQSAQADRQDSRRLRRIDNQRNAPRAAERRDLRKGQDISENVRDMRADRRLCFRRKQPGKRLERVGRVEQPRSGDLGFGAEVVQRPRDGVVLKTGDHNAVSRPHERADGDVQRVRGVHGEHDLLRLCIKHCRRLFPAGVDCVRCRHCGRVPAASRACKVRHGVPERLCDRGRLLKRGRAAVKIDHTRTSSIEPLSNTLYRCAYPASAPRSRCSARTPSRAPTRIA